ncbi:MAG: type 1 glutamine amidotransferase domain-containing protein [Bacteriovoracaceae bacterium]
MSEKNYFETKNLSLRIQCLEGRRIAFLATDGVEQLELIEPKLALESAGALVDIISPHNGVIKAWHQHNWGDNIPIDVHLSIASVENYDALVLAGGLLNQDKLRNQAAAVRFLQDFVKEGKPIAAIGHGVQILIETTNLKDRYLTSWPALKTDLVNAGAHWINKDVVVDNGLITSRTIDDIPSFIQVIIREFSERPTRESFSRNNFISILSLTSWLIIFLSI